MITVLLLVSHSVKRISQLEKARLLVGMDPDHSNTERLHSLLNIYIYGRTEDTCLMRKIGWRQITKLCAMVSKCPNQLKCFSKPKFGKAHAHRWLTKHSVVNWRYARWSIAYGATRNNS